jgi:ubiquinone biosynthesis protein
MPRPRTARIVLRSAVILSWLMWHLARLAMRLCVPPGLRRRSRAELVGTGIAAFCESCGATFVKIGQILSMRTDLFPAETAAELSRLKDRMRPVDHPTSVRIIERQLGAPIDTLFPVFERTPLASASIASVYRAWLPDGRPVAVKVRRPRVARVVADDLALLRSLAKRLAGIRRMRQLPLPEILEEIFGHVESQLDLHREATNLRRLNANFAGCPGVHLPAVIEGYCGEEVLTMEYISLPLAADYDGRLRSSLVTALRALYRMTFIDGFVHCDLHQGNLYLRDGGEVVIVDAGFVVELTDVERLRFARFFHGFITNSGEECARIIRQSAIITPPAFDEQAFTRDVTDLVSRASGRSAQEFDVARFVMDLFRVQSRHQVYGSTPFVMPIIALLVMEGLVRQVVPDLDFQREARPFLAASLLPGLLRERPSPY